MPKTRSLRSKYSTGRRWTAGDAQVVLSALDASGLSIAAFADREGLDPQRVYWWRRRLSQIPEHVPEFVEVPQAPVASERIEIILPSGIIVRVSPSVDADTLRRLTDALTQVSSC